MIKIRLSKPGFPWNGWSFNNCMVAVGPADDSIAAERLISFHCNERGTKSVLKANPGYAAYSVMFQTRKDSPASKAKMREILDFLRANSGDQEALEEWGFRWDQRVSQIDGSKFIDRRMHDARGQLEFLPQSMGYFEPK